MKIQILILLFSMTASVGFSQVSNNPAFTNVHHNKNNISLRNFDGTNSTIYVNGTSATLDNSNGTSSTINFFSPTSWNLTSSDGTNSSVTHNGASSTVINSDGTQFVINHKQNSSSFSSGLGNHSVTHFFGNVKEQRHKDIIDVLVHMNWFIQQKQLLISKHAVDLSN